MAKKREPTKPPTWTIYRIAAEQLRLGTADALTAAIEKAAAKFKVRATKLTRTNV
jgi:hypothetical protein